MAPGKSLAVQGKPATPAASCVAPVGETKPKSASAAAKQTVGAGPIDGMDCSSQPGETVAQAQSRRYLEVKRWDRGAIEAYSEKLAAFLDHLSSPERVVTTRSEERWAQQGLMGRQGSQTGTAVETRPNVDFTSLDLWNSKFLADSRPFEQIKGLPAMDKARKTAKELDQALRRGNTSALPPLLQPMLDRLRATRVELSGVEAASLQRLFALPENAEAQQDADAARRALDTAPTRGWSESIVDYFKLRESYRRFQVLLPGLPESERTDAEWAVERLGRALRLAQTEVRSRDAAIDAGARAQSKWDRVGMVESFFSPFEHHAYSVASRASRDGVESAERRLEGHLEAARRCVDELSALFFPSPVAAD